MPPGSPGRRRLSHAPSSRRRAPALARVLPLADPPAAARAPFLQRSEPFSGGSRYNLFLPGATAGGGTSRAPFPPPPSLPPSPLRQPLQDEL